MVFDGNAAHRCAKSEIRISKSETAVKRLFHSRTGRKRCQTNELPCDAASAFAGSYGGQAGLSRLRRDKKADPNCSRLRTRWRFRADGRLISDETLSPAEFLVRSSFLRRSTALMPPCSFHRARSTSLIPPRQTYQNYCSSIEFDKCYSGQRHCILSTRTFSSYSHILLFCRHRLAKFKIFP